MLALIAAVALSGCATAIGAAMAAGEIRQGLAGLQQLVAGSTAAEPITVAMPDSLSAPVAGTYRGFQALGDDTVRFYLRTAAAPSAPIVDSTGVITGYALAGIAAASLDTLEMRTANWSVVGEEEDGGRAIFFIEGTHAPAPTARALYPAAFLGRVSAAESATAAMQHDTLMAMAVDMSAPPIDELAGLRIAQQLFSSVAEGVFTLNPGGGAVYRQEYEIEDGRRLTLHFERMSRTTLPD